MPLEKANINGITHFIITQFNNTVLAYNFIRSPYPSIHYSTWSQDGSGNIKPGGRFISDNDALNEQQAMRDFCVRSGLIRECDLLANDKLPDYIGMIDRLRGKGQAFEDEKLLADLKKQTEQILGEPKDMFVDKEAVINAHEHHSEQTTEHFHGQIELG